jgi:hypothetical protein
MKVAMVKQVLDGNGPWRGSRWGEGNPVDLFAVWPGKAKFWQMTVLLRADWYIIPQQRNTAYTYMTGMAAPSAPIISGNTQGAFVP